VLEDTKEELEGAGHQADQEHSKSFSKTLAAPLPWTCELSTVYIMAFEPTNGN
jgi:hypothetical protein